jgi:hypothetical protein
MEFACGHFLDLTAKSGKVYRWQNFWIKENVGSYSFIPFGFSGLTTNRQGDNIEATLVFPNNELSRQWAVSACQEKWLAQVQVILFNPDDKSDQTVLHTYAGQVSAAGWGDTAINLRLNSLLDAVGSEIPARRLSQDLVGFVPTSSNIQLF